MTAAAVLASSEEEPASADADTLLSALPGPLVALDSDDRFRFANPAAEQFFGGGAGWLYRRALEDVVPRDSPLVALVCQARSRGAGIHEHALKIDSLRTGVRSAAVQATPLGQPAGWILVTLQEHTLADDIERQTQSHGASRSLSAIASALAHEIKNPLSGIRGAAQLIEESTGPQHSELTGLIRDETDRLCALVDRMELFTDTRVLERGPVNVYEVLDHVRGLAQAGFARNVKFVERYDPSLPPVSGSRGLLVQIFLNLVKNAAEACPEAGGEIVLSTAFRSDVRVAMPGGGERRHVPIEVGIADNGGGIPEHVSERLFEPFVTTRPGGTGLGLALVAKYVGDHDGAVECESRARGTLFRVRLPVWAGGGET